MLQSFPFMMSNFSWQMVVLPVDHSLQIKEGTALPALSHSTSYSPLATFVQPLVINSLKVLAVHQALQTLLSSILPLLTLHE